MLNNIKYLSVMFVFLNFRCKPNIFGKRCNSCKHGHYDFPFCEKCDCDIRGSTDVICDPVSIDFFFFLCLCSPHIFE